MENKYYRLIVNISLPTLKRKHSFSGTDKAQTFYNCVAFAQGFIYGFCCNSNIPISTNLVQSLDGFFWWNTKTGENVITIETENGKVIKTEKDMDDLKPFI